MPQVVAGLVFGLVLIFLATGRAKELTTADVAQEELEQAGLEFSMPSLQEAIYVISPRSVDLFRKANIDDSDFRDALGAPTVFTGSIPLVRSILERIDSANLNCDIESDGRRCRRIEDFLRLFNPAADEDFWDLGILFDKPGENERLCFPTQVSGNQRDELCQNLETPVGLREPDGAPPRPLLSHAIAGGHPNVAACLLALCGPLDPYLDVVPVLSQHPDASTTAQKHMLAVLDLRAGMRTRPAWGTGAGPRTRGC